MYIVFVQTFIGISYLFKLLSVYRICSNCYWYIVFVKTFTSILYLFKLLPVYCICSNFYW